MKNQVLQKKEKALIAIADAEQSKDFPRTLFTKEEKQLNVMSNVIINSIKKSKKGKELFALTDANPPMDIKKLLFKKDNEKDTNALLMKLIKSTNIKQPQKEKVLLALGDAPNLSSKIISIIEKNLGHKVNKIVPFLSSSSSSTASTAAPSSSSSSSSKTVQSKSSSKNTVIKDSITKKQLKSMIQKK